jgi:hypothetical protein
MAITYQIDPPAKLVRTQIQGRLNLEDILSHLHLLKSDPKFDSRFANLIDLSGFAGSDVNTESMKALAQGLQGEVFSRDAKRAVVAPDGPAFELASRFQSLRPDPENFQVFHTVDEARHWLNADHKKAMLFE